ncbi:hypothetical protein MKX03_026561 [Papaver bracteatum]|nr:hypothetical protein MKX03_026561 [Papaver bracteatum]
MADLLEPPPFSNLHPSSSSSSSVYFHTQKPNFFRLQNNQLKPSFLYLHSPPPLLKPLYCSVSSSGAIDPLQPKLPPIENIPNPNPNGGEMRDPRDSISSSSSNSTTESRKKDRRKTVTMLLRDPVVCLSINETGNRFKYFPEHKLPDNVIATTDAKTALDGADFCLHVVPVSSSSFLGDISGHVNSSLPIISISKGLELNTLKMMSQIIPQALGNPRQPFVALSGPSFALELMKKLPTAMVVTSKDQKLASSVQQLLSSQHLRISTSSDVTGVEIASALKNVLAIAAGIVEGMDHGNNSMTTLVAQGCSEIRWLATKMGGKAARITGLSGSGDTMLTCFVNLSRNRTLRVRLGRGETLDDILSSMNQVAEGVSTAGAVIALAQKYNIKMPVLTTVACIIDNELTPQKAILELMGLPQVEEV